MTQEWVDFIAYFTQNNPSPVMTPILKNTSIVDFSEKNISVSCENLGMKIFLETRKKEFERAFSKKVGKDIHITFIVRGKIKKKGKKIETTPLFDFKETKEEIIRKSGLQAKHTFANFAVSTSNQFAYTAAKSVSQNIGVAYNPLFIYGGVGVGKTHLTQAVAHAVLEKDSIKKVLYCTSEEFTNDLIESIREKSTALFRRKYRILHLLVMDDIQFIAGKNYIQEEMYHTFNTLIKNGGQVVFTSDRPPKEIERLEDRLRSRFSGGLTIDVQKPDFELRSAILLIKAQERNIDIDIETIKLIAARIDDARELEGKLLEIYARSILENQKITTNMIENELNKKKDDIAKKRSPSEIIKIVCGFYGIKPALIKNETRKEKISHTRQILMFILRSTLKLTYEEIAYILRRKDHTTIIHGVEKITNLTMQNPVFKEEIDRVINSL